MIICKFNILEFKRGDEQGSQKQFPCKRMFEHLSFCVAYENGQKKAQIRRPDLFSRRCIWKGISFAVFKNFAATLARQPSAASLAPRLDKFVKITIFVQTRRNRKASRALVTNCRIDFRPTSSQPKLDLKKTFCQGLKICSVCQKLILIQWIWISYSNKVKDFDLIVNKIKISLIQSLKCAW